MMLLVMLLHSPLIVADSCPFLPLDPPSAVVLNAAGLWSNVTAALSEVDSILQDASKDMGLAAVITYGDQMIYHAGYGVASESKSSSAPVFDTTVWRLGSVTKVFTALMMMHLIDNNSIESFEVPITDLIPDFAPNGSGLAREITLSSIASHLGGIPREVPAPCFSDVSKCNLTTQELVPVLNNMSLLWPPGSRPSYSNLGYSLLGRALEKRSNGKSYETYVEEDLLEPIGMLSSGFGWNDTVLANLARGAFPTQPVTHLGWANPNGEMYTTAADMAKFLLVLTGSDNPILSPWRLRQWAQPKFLLPDGVR
jgi:CubicO group peptidase (beta-lactamase class C family)